MQTRTLCCLLSATFIYFFVSMGFFGGALAQGAPADSLQKELDAFRENPRAFLNRQPKKYADFQLSRTVNVSRFSKEEIVNKDFIEIKEERGKNCRIPDEKHMQSGKSGRERFQLFAGINPENDVSQFTDNLDLLTTLEQMEARGLRKANLQTLPWSGDYWAIAKGVLGARPFDKKFFQFDNWKSRLEYVQENNLFKIFQSGDSAAIENLAPAEKYDLLVGDPQAAATVRMWMEGKPYYDQHGKVEEWMGICHGWAAAAFMATKPMRAITVKAFDGKTDIRLFPSEIKGLSSFVWANSYYPQRTLGERCNAKEPEQDENGRLIDARCFDSNPGSWHMAVVNQVGAARRSFVMDATYDYEVWNHPVYAYSYSYFNVAKMEKAETLADAIVPIDQVENDIFKKYRSPQAKYLVGVAMKVGYIVEADAQKTENAVEERRVWVRYVYDLELDENHKIIGGEWLMNSHPDFLWVPDRMADPKTIWDQFLDKDDWDRQGPLPPAWRQAALQASRQGSLLVTIVNALVDLSSNF